MASETVMVRDFRCNGCGAPLPIPKNSRGRVKCPSCKNESVIENLVKNAEMADKENINSGFPLIASPATLHRQLVLFLSQSPIMPLDVFEKAEVVREEHYCVPAYLFYCTATASFTYEAGNVREHKVGVTSGGKNYTSTRVKTIESLEWTQMGGMANASATVFSSGNRQFASQIQKTYMLLDHHRLIDFDELDFPHDVKTLDYNLPQTASFNEYVKPHMEKLLEENAHASLEGKKTDNFAMGGNKIDKDEVIRVFLGFYRVVCKYGDKEYALWLTGDGSKAFHEGMPDDPQRQNAIDAKKQSMEREVSSIPMPKKTVPLISGVVAILLGFMLVSTGSELGILLGFFGLSFAIVSHLVNLQRRESKCAAVRAQYQKEIDAITGQTSNVVEQFRAKKQALRGIYEQEVTGDASGFYSTW